MHVLYHHIVTTSILLLRAFHHWFNSFKWGRCWFLLPCFVYCIENETTSFAWNCVFYRFNVCYTCRMCVAIHSPLPTHPWTYKTKIALNLIQPHCIGYCYQFHVWFKCPLFQCIYIIFIVQTNNSRLFRTFECFDQILHLLDMSLDLHLTTFKSNSLEQKNNSNIKMHSETVEWSLWMNFAEASKVN